MHGTLNLFRQPPGAWDLIVTDGESTQVREGHFYISHFTVRVEPDTVSAQAVAAPVTLHGGPFLQGIEVVLTDPIGEPVPLTLTQVTLDSVTVAVTPDGQRGYSDLRVTNPNGDTLRVEDTLWIEDRNRELRFPAPYVTLQDAFDIAFDGDTITVAAGVHTNANARAHDKNLLVRGDVPGESILEGAETWIRLSGVDARTLVTGLTFRNTRTMAIGASGSCRIVGNVFAYNTAIFGTECNYGDPEICYEGEGAGVRITGTAEIRDNVFIGNRAGSGAGAVHVVPFPSSDSADTVVIAGNVFANNLSRRWRGPDAGYSLHVEGTHVVVEGNTFVHDGFPGNLSVTLRSIHSARFTHNVITGEEGYGHTTYAVGAHGPLETDCNALHSATLSLLADGAGTGSLFEVDPLFCDPADDDYTLSLYSPIHPDSTACGQIGALGVGCAVTPIGDGSGAEIIPVPPALRMGRAAPNPFTPRVRIPFAVPAPGAAVRIEVFDPAGRRIRTLVAGELSPGAYVAEWDGVTPAGLTAGSGVYFVRMHAPGYTRTQAVTLIR